MNKLFTLVFLLALCFTSFGQKYVTKNGHIKFYSETPIETIVAHNHQVNSAIDKSNGNFIFKVLIKSFEFKKAMMQEHFNENYMESDKFPTAKFSGKIQNFDAIHFNDDGIYDVIVKGSLTIHGISREVESSGSFEIKGDNITARSSFIVKPSDYDIKIAKAVEDQIAKSIEVTINVVLDKIN